MASRMTSGSGGAHDGVPRRHRVRHAGRGESLPLVETEDNEPPACIRERDER